MKLNKMKKEDLELCSYNELTQMILKEAGKSLNTPTIFKKICKLLDMSDDEYASKIGDFYTSLTTDKTFILLDDATWDLTERHSVKVNLEDDSEEDLTETEEVLEDEMDDMATDDMHDMDDNIQDDDTDLDDADDEIEDDELTIIDEEDMQDDEL